MKKILFFLIATLFCTIRTFAQQAPVIKVNGSKTGPWSFHFEAGTTACINFTAYASDITSDDTTIIEWNKGLPPAGTFTNTNSDSVALVKNDEAVICWQPNEKDGCKTYYFMVYARYKNKPEIRPSQVVISFTIWTHPTFTDHIIPKGNGTYVFVPQIIDGCGIRYNDTSGVQYFWSMPDRPATRETWGSVPTIWYDSVRILTHTFPKNGTYFYKQWISEPFKGAHNVFRLDSIHVTDVLETGIQNIENKFSLYPNPAKNLLYLQSSAEVNNLEMYDVIGRKVLINYTPNGDEYRIELPELSKGVYFIHLITAQQQRFSQKVCIE